MAITRQVKNYKIIVNNSYKAVVGGKLEKYADSMIVDAIDGNLKLGSNKKVITNGGTES